MVHHAGALSGFSTLVAFLPSDGIGMTVFANAGGVAGPLMLVSNRILDSALGLTDSLAPARFASFFTPSA